MTRAAAQAIAALAPAMEKIPGGFPYLLYAALEAPEGVTLRIVSATPLPPADPVSPGGEFRAGVRVRQQAA